MGRISWNNSDTGEKAQFVADVLKESLFNYAFDSNKVPSLNLHYFCKDYMNSALRAENGVIKDGNMIPLVEEFEEIVRNSLWLPNGVSDAVLSFKNKQGFYINVSKDKNTDVSTRIKYYKDSATYIDAVLQADMDYLESLLKQMESLLNSATFTIDEKKMLYFCTREFLSELINIGISKGHLYNETMTILFKNFTPADDIGFIMNFLKSLLPKKEKYSVVFGITDKTYNEMNRIISGLRSATIEEEERLHSSYVAETNIESYDSVSALMIAKSSFSAILGIYNCCMHDTDLKVNPNGLAKAENGERYHLINDSKNLLSKNRNKVKDERVRWLRVAVTKRPTNNLLSCFELHNNALIRNDPQTQLLNLWTIVELLIETKQEQMAKINYISNMLSCIMCNIYFARLIKTLLDQITLTKQVKSIIRQELRGKNDLQKFSLILKDNSALKANIISAISDYPLEVYKIENFCEIFSSPSNMKNYLLRHSNRLRWQVMRIYRNRCMIVHNGSHCNYIDSIVENLHYYVDEVFDYMFLRMSEGITNTKSIFSYARIKEHEHLQILSKQSPLSDDEYLSVIFDY